MTTRNAHRPALAGILMAMAFGAGVCAQDAAAPATATNEVPAEVSPAAASAQEPAAEEAAGGAEAESRPPKAPPAHRGSEMREAFKGTGSKYGISGRVNKLPAKKAAKREKGAWRLKLDLGMDTASGNRDTIRCNGTASATKETEFHYLQAKATGRYGESDDEKDAENLAVDAKYQRKLTERAYASVDGSAYHDRIADLSYRAYGSVSIGRHFVLTDRTALNVEVGPGYVAERKGGETEGFVAGRAAQYLEFLVTPSLQVWQAIEYVPSMEDSRVYFVNAEVGLETALVANLGLRFTVEDRYDSNPAEGKKNNDLLTSTALTWTF